MRARIILGTLLGVAAVAVASYITYLNVDLLELRFRLLGELTAPIWVALAGLFLLGFLPPALLLVLRALSGELDERRRRRRRRTARSLAAALRRAVDAAADGQWPRVVDELAPVMGKKTEEFHALLLYGEALRRTGRPERATEVHRRASALYPESAAVLYQLAEDLEQQGDLSGAETARGRILQLDGLGAGVLRRRIEAAENAGDASSSAILREELAVRLGEGS